MYSRVKKEKRLPTVAAQHSVMVASDMAGALAHS